MSPPEGWLSMIFCGLEACKPGPRKVDINSLPVVLEMGLLVDGSEVNGARNACVIEEDVDSSEFLTDFFEHVPHIFWVAHITLDLECPVRKAQVLYQAVHVCPGFFEGRWTPSHDHHVPSANRRLECKGPAHSGSPPCDDDHFSCQGGIGVPHVIQRVSFR